MRKLVSARIWLSLGILLIILPATAADACRELFSFSPVNENPSFHRYSHWYPTPNNGDSINHEWQIVTTTALNLGLDAEFNQTFHNFKQLNHYLMKVQSLSAFALKERGYNKVSFLLPDDLMSARELEADFNFEVPELKYFHLIDVGRAWILLQAGPEKAIRFLENKKLRQGEKYWQEDLAVIEFLESQINPPSNVKAARSSRIKPLRHDHSTSIFAALVGGLF